MRHILVAASLLGFMSVVHAENGTLVAHVPAGADREVIIAVMRHALESHGWSVVTADARAIVASIDGNKTDASIQLSLEQSSITYEGHATLTVVSNAQSVKKPSAIPARWLRALRTDISNALVTMPEKANH